MDVDDLLEVGSRLEGLTDDWRIWPNCSSFRGPSLVRRLPGERYLAVIPMLYTWALVTGPISTAEFGYDDRWCYDSLFAATAAGRVWSGDGEPEGWHRHPVSGRRRPGGDPAEEYIHP